MNPYQREEPYQQPQGYSSGHPHQRQHYGDYSAPMTTGESSTSGRGPHSYPQGNSTTSVGPHASPAGYHQHYHYAQSQQQQQQQQSISDEDAHHYENYYHYGNANQPIGMDSPREMERRGGDRHHAAFSSPSDGPQYAYPYHEHSFHNNRYPPNSYQEQQQQHLQQQQHPSLTQQAQPSSGYYDSGAPAMSSYGTQQHHHRHHQHVYTQDPNAISYLPAQQSQRQQQSLFPAPGYAPAPPVVEILHTPSGEGEQHNSGEADFVASSSSAGVEQVDVVVMTSSSSTAQQHHSHGPSTPAASSSSRRDRTAAVGGGRGNRRGEGSRDDRGSANAPGDGSCSSYYASKSEDKRSSKKKRAREDASGENITSSSGNNNSSSSSKRTRSWESGAMPFIEDAKTAAYTIPRSAPHVMVPAISPETSQQRALRLKSGDAVQGTREGDGGGKKGETESNSVPVDVAAFLDIVAYCVCQGGPTAEEELNVREARNPNFDFFNANWDDPKMLYYRWKLYSLLQGDSFLGWRSEPFQIERGPLAYVWVPPSSLKAGAESLSGAFGITAESGVVSSPPPPPPSALWLSKLVVSQQRVFTALPPAAIREWQVLLDPAVLLAPALTPASTTPRSVDAVVTAAREALLDSEKIAERTIFAVDHGVTAPEHTMSFLLDAVIRVAWEATDVFRSAKASSSMLFVLPPAEQRETCTKMGLQCITLLWYLFILNDITRNCDAAYVDDGELERMYESEMATAPLAAAKSSSLSPSSTLPGDVVFNIKQHQQQQQQQQQQLQRQQHGITPLAIAITAILRTVAESCLMVVFAILTRTGSVTVNSHCGHTGGTAISALASTEAAASPALQQQQQQVLPGIDLYYTVKALVAEKKAQDPTSTQQQQQQQQKKKTPEESTPCDAHTVGVMAVLLFAWLEHLVDSWFTPPALPSGNNNNNNNSGMTTAAAAATAAAVGPPSETATGCLGVRTQAMFEKKYPFFFKR